MGALRVDEIVNVDTKDVKEHAGILLVNIPKSKMKTRKCFTIDGEYYETVRKYQLLRQKNVKTSRFFLNYRNQKCTVQPIGVNKMQAMPQRIAEFLNLADPSLYTGKREVVYECSSCTDIF